MALSNLFAWNNDVIATDISSACGASDTPDQTPTACGSACGAGDK